MTLKIERPQLPPAGPAWAGSLMGTSIAATLSHVHHFELLGDIMVVLATAILLVIILGFLKYRNPHFHQEFMGPWGMTSMGILAWGAAMTSLTGHWSVQAYAWIIGTALGVVVCLNQLRKFHGAPTFLWGLALVAPMVGATVGGQLAQSGFFSESTSHTIHSLAVVCFFMSFLTAPPTFARVYLSVIRGNFHLPLGLSGTAWIPLGIVGQSTAAAQVLAVGDTWKHVAVIYGYVMFTLGIPMFAYAAYKFWGSLPKIPDYTPGWWGSTFPTGTLCLGSHYLAGSTGHAWWDTLSLIFLVVLFCHWGVSALRFLGWLSGVPRVSPK